MLGLLVLVYNLKVVYVVNIIVFGEEGILIFFFYEVNKLRIVVLKKKRWCVDKIMFIIFIFWVIIEL